MLSLSSSQENSTASTLLPVLKQTVQVTFNYEVHFTENLFDSANPLFAQVLTREQSSPRLLVVIDSGVLVAIPRLRDQVVEYAESHGLDLAIVPLVVPAGEAIKNHQKWPKAIQGLMEGNGLCRHSYVVAIGGGALLDMVGYAAATAHRGMRLIRVPTTVLAQNDSGVGVKNGVNAYGKKNFLGTFSPPYAVLNDSCFLKKLGDRDWRAGIAEAIKVALIKDADFFEFITAQTDALAQRDLSTMNQLIHRCAELHLNHIATGGDPFEFGSSRPLDFGHWAAHKLEQLTDYRLRHGEAVAIGLALDCTYSRLTGRLTIAAWEKILDTLQSLGFTLYVPELEEGIDFPDDERCVFQGLDEFREHLGGELTLMLLQGIGQGLEVHWVDREIYREAIAILKTYGLETCNPAEHRMAS